MFQPFVIRLVYPFLKEAIIGKRSLRAALTNNKKKVVVLGIVMASITINLFSVPKIISLSLLQLHNQKLIQEYEKTKTDIERLEKENKELKKNLEDASQGQTPTPSQSAPSNPNTPLPPFNTHALNALDSEARRRVQ